MLLRLPIIFRVIGKLRAGYKICGVALVLSGLIQHFLVQQNRSFANWFSKSVRATLRTKDETGRQLETGVLMVPYVVACCLPRVLRSLETPPGIAFQTLFRNGKYTRFAVRAKGVQNERYKSSLR